MRRTFGMVALCLLCASSVAAQVAIDEALTIDDTAGGVFIASATRDPAGSRQAVYCFGILETAQIRWLDNGDAPTTTVGSPADEGAVIEIFGHAFIAAARFIRTTGVSGLIHFTCYPRFPAWVQ